MTASIVCAYIFAKQAVANATLAFFLAYIQLFADCPLYNFFRLKAAYVYSVLGKVSSLTAAADSNAVCFGYFG